METKTKKIISFIFINMLFIIAYQKKKYIYMLFIIEKLEHKIVRYIILLILMLFSW